jgi:hypothetical protein
MAPKGWTSLKEGLPPNEQLALVVLLRDCRRRRRWIHGNPTWISNGKRRESAPDREINAPFRAQKTGGNGAQGLESHSKQVPERGFLLSSEISVGFRSEDSSRNCKTEMKGIDEDGRWATPRRFS